MHVFRGLPHPLLKRPSAVAIGNFDGVHLGHQALLKSVVHAASERGLVPSVVTFEPHPREVLGADPLPRISTLLDKIEAILATGIERIYIMPFSRRMAALSASEFVEDILVDGLDTRWLMVGEDFRFGSDRTGDVESLHAFGAEHHFEVFASPLVFHGTSKVSSTRIREELAKGDLYEAYLMLGRRYTMAGRVIHGAALGRTLGYPTLNLAPIPPGSRARPAVTGVFAVRVEGLGPSIRPAVASIGIKPTVTNERRWLLETHVFDWSGSAYGKYVRVHFVEKRRDEKKFGSIEELRAAIESDALRARRILGCTPGDGIFKP